MSSEACPMAGGDGPRSYSQNSSYQRGGLEIAKEAIHKTIRDNLNFMNNNHFHGTFRIADFGCSVGRNTLQAVENLIEAVEQEYHRGFQVQNNPSPPPLEFQVFFNDLPGNDFNSLPSHGKYFAAGVPGSFYTRLFPKSTLSVGFSSYSLHWLSKVPKDVVDSNSPAWNKGSIQCTGYSKEVAKAYLGKFQDDFANFLNARAPEIASGGLMVILIAGRPNGIPMSHTAMGAGYDLLGSCLLDAAKSGMVREEEVDSFNLPLYYTTPKEPEEIINQNGYFSIESMGELQHPMTRKESGLKPELVAKIMRAALDGVVKKHFQNDGIVDKIFDDFTLKLAEHWSSIFGLSHHHIELYTVLKRIK